MKPNSTPAPTVQNKPYSPNTYSIPSSPVPSTPPPSANVVKQKKGFPKIIIFAVMALLLIVAAAAAYKIISKPSVQKSSGTITWWGLWEDKSVVQPLIDEYQSKHGGVTINYVRQSPQDYRERLTNSLAKGSGPDIFTYHNTWVPMFRSSMDSLPATTMNPADYAKTFYPIASSDLTSGSNIVGIPLMYDALTLFVNQDIFDKAGKTVPTTWDDFRSVARSLTVKDDQGVITQAGAAMGRTENVDHWPEILALLMLQNGVDLSNPTGKTAQDALTYFTIFSTTDGIWDASQPSSTQAFAAGKLAMYIGPSWRAFDVIQQNPSLRFKTYSIPQLPKDSPNQPDITYATYWAQGVWSGSGNKSLAWDFLKFLSTQDSLTKLYQNETRLRNFGEPYPRVDMANLLNSHPLVGSLVNQAPGAVTWYLASRTFDGPTGINSQMINYFGDAINAVISGNTPADKALLTAANGVAQVLAQYKLIAK
jgi:multiple sugar transport system substrate-binding protein